MDSAIIVNNLIGKSKDKPYTVVLKTSSSSSKKLPDHLGDAPGKWVALFSRQSGEPATGM